MMVCMLGSSGSRPSTNWGDGYRRRLLYGSLDNKAADKLEEFLNRSKKELEEVWWDGLHWNLLAEVDHWRQRFPSYRLLIF